MATIAEQRAAFLAERTQKAAKIAAIMQKAADEGATLDTQEQEEFDEAGQDIEAIDAHLKRLDTAERYQIQSATPVEATTTKAAADSRAGVITVKNNVPKGTSFTRFAIAVARSKGNLMQAAEIAKGWDDTTPEVANVLKAAAGFGTTNVGEWHKANPVAAGTTTDPTWASPLVQYQVMNSEFVELLRPATIMGRIQGLRRVPFNIRMAAQTSASTVNWVGKGRQKPVSSLGFEEIRMGFTKAAGIVVMTDELVRFSNPSAEAVVQDDLIRTMAQFLDLNFVDPAKAAVPDVSPASITNGAPNQAATGVTLEAFNADLAAGLTAFANSNLNTAGGVIITTPQIAVSIGMMRNTLGQIEYPGVGASGGTLFGYQLITSNNVPQGLLIFAVPSEIFLADDGVVTLDASNEASLSMYDNPDAVGGAQLVSLWQHNMTAIRAERWINWQRRRPQAVFYITGAAYAP